MSAKPKTRVYLWGHPLLQAITPTHSPLRGLPFVSLINIPRQGCVYRFIVPQTKGLTDYDMIITA